MIEERPYLEIPKPSEEDYRLYEEWVKRKEEEQDKEERKVIIIDI